MKFSLPRLRNCIIVFMTLTYLAGADAVQGADWQSAGRSLAATQAGTATFYQMASDLLWRRSDDNRFTAYKDLLDAGKEPAPTEAISKSKELMNGHKWELFVLELSFIGWYLLGFVTLGIGLLWVVPYYNAVHADYYRALAGDQFKN